MEGVEHVEGSGECIGVTVEMDVTDQPVFGNECELGHSTTILGKARLVNVMKSGTKHWLGRN